MRVHDFHSGRVSHYSDHRYFHSGGSTFIPFPNIFIPGGETSTKKSKILNMIGATTNMKSEILIRKKSISTIKHEFFFMTEFIVLERYRRSIFVEARITIQSRARNISGMRGFTHRRISIV